MARISELHYSNAYARNSNVAEFLEVSLDPSEMAADFTVGFYNSDGSLILEVNLANAGVVKTFDPASGEDVYVISSSVFGVFLTDPDSDSNNNAEAFSLTNTVTDDVINFFDIGGGETDIEADGGAADGAVSTNIAVPTGPQAATYSIQFNQPDPTTPVAVAVSLGDSGVCFTPGTRIETAQGQRPVEDLRPGDLLLTRDAGMQPLRWVGGRQVPAAGALAPVVIPAGMLGLEAALEVSPQHRMLVEDWRADLLVGSDTEASGVLVAALHLVDGDRVVRRRGGMVRYIHLLFDAHQLVRANGAWSESYHPGALGLNAMSFETRDEILALFPQLMHAPTGYGASARPTLRAYEAQLLYGADMV